MGGNNSKCNTSLANTNKSIKLIQGQIKSEPTTCTENLNKINTEINSLSKQYALDKNSVNCNSFIKKTQDNNLLTAKIETANTICNNSTNTKSTLVNELTGTATVYNNASNKLSANTNLSTTNYNSIIEELKNEITTTIEKYNNLLKIVPASVVAAAAAMDTTANTTANTTAAAKSTFVSSTNSTNSTNSANSANSANSINSCNNTSVKNTAKIAALNAKIAKNSIKQTAPLNCTELSNQQSNAYQSKFNSINNQITLIKNSNSSLMSQLSAVSTAVTKTSNQASTDLQTIKSLQSSIKSNITTLGQTNTQYFNELSFISNLQNEINISSKLNFKITDQYRSLNNQHDQITNNSLSLTNYTNQLEQLQSISTTITQIQTLALIPINTLISPTGSIGLIRTQLLSLFVAPSGGNLGLNWFAWSAVAMARVMLMAMCVANIGNQLYIANINLVDCINGLNTIITSVPSNTNQIITKAIANLNMALNALNNISGKPVTMQYPGDNGTASGKTFCAGGWGNGPTGVVPKFMTCQNGTTNTGASIKCNTTGINQDWTINCIYLNNLYTVSKVYSALLLKADSPPNGSSGQKSPQDSVETITNPPTTITVNYPAPNSSYTMYNSSATMLYNMNTTVTSIITSLNLISSSLQDLSNQTFVGLLPPKISTQLPIIVNNATKFIGDNGTVDGNTYCMGGWGGGNKNKLMGCLYGENSSTGDEILCTKTGVAASYYCTPNSGSYTYIGAYNDVASPRAIPILYTAMVTSVAQAMTVASSLGATVFGIQNGGQLFYNISYNITAALTSAKQYGQKLASNGANANACNKPLGCFGVNQVYVITTYYSNVNAPAPPNISPPSNISTSAVSAAAKSTFISSNLHSRQMQYPQTHLITNSSSSMGETLKNHFKGV